MSMKNVLRRGKTPRRFLSASLAPLALLGAGAAFFAPAGARATVPPGFSETLIAGSQLQFPTAMEWSPDGRLFVCEQHGNLRIIKNGQLLGGAALTFQNVNFDGERGLLGITFDPNFAQNQYLYLYYTVNDTVVHNRVSRFTITGDVINPASELVLMNIDPLSSATNHNGGALHFGPDGKLYIATGENANRANAQTLANRLGKILRINSDGSIPTDNPFFNTATGENRAIWALGLRNPYTFAFQPGTLRMLINDVGQNTWEEINDGYAGTNYGWPNSEGLGATNGDRDPLLAYKHGGAGNEGFAITGGSFYNPPAPNFPAQFIGGYFYADYVNNWVRFLDVQRGNASTPFASNMAGPVDLKVGPDGAVYVLARANGGVIRIAHTANYQYTATDLDTASMDNKTRLLLQAKNGKTALWKLEDGPGTIQNSLNVPTVSGYLPRGVAVSSNGTTRLLRADGANRARVDNYNSILDSVGVFSFAPAGYTPTAISASPTGSDFRLLWTNNRQRTIAVWNVGATGAITKGVTFNLPVGWNAKTVAQGANEKTFLLLTHQDGRAAIWRLSATLTLENATAYGPYAGLQATDVAADTTDIRLLWSGDTGRAAVWFLNADGVLQTGQPFAPMGYTPRRIALGDLDGRTRLLWNGDTGRTALWLLRMDTSLESGVLFGAR